ncbi:MAG TPA: DUF4398 domain-containing protein [Spirochaetota bacterium]|nr:DUF4398 domain-containing protein [Spirochaetota bacterium]
MLLDGNKKKYQYYKIITVFTLLVILAGCVDVDKTIAYAEAALKQAELVGAKHYAAAEVHTAREKITEAKSLKEEDKKAANQTALEALQQARLAYYKTLQLRPQKEKAVTAKTRENAREHNAPVLASNTYRKAESEFDKAKAIYKQISALSNRLHKLEQTAEDE